MRFLFIASGRSVPSTRFRILPYVPVLREAGHRCDVAFSFPEKYDYFRVIGWRASQFLKRTTRRWHVFLAGLRHYDTIVIEREVFDDDTFYVEKALRQRCTRMVLDVDDGIHLKFPDKFAEVAGMCDAAIAGNQALEEVLGRHCREVVRVPTCVRLGDYQQKSSFEIGGRVTVGWIGTTHNVNFLTECATSIRQTAQHVQPFRLLVVAPSDEHLGKIDFGSAEVEFRKWNPVTEVDSIREMDIGLMPLPTGDDWMKYKCGLKLIQYLAVGTPGIATPIGVNAEILRESRVGLAATSDEEWTLALTELLTNRDRRLEMGLAGRDLVRDQFSIESNWRRVEAVLVGKR